MPPACRPSCASDSGLRDPDYPLPTWFNVAPYDLCPGQAPIIRPIGASVTITSLYGVNNDGSCAVIETIYASDDVYALGDVMPMTAFATATRRRE